jgi:hypothetical protein
MGASLTVFLCLHHFEENELSKYGLTALILLLCFVSIPPMMSAQTPQLDFPYSQGWLGADDAYSVPLTATRSLWLFGDTFVADANTTLRSQHKAMVRNSIGVSDCSFAPCKMTYLWTDKNGATPRSFIDSGREDLWYWPFDAFRDGQTLYISLMIVRNKPGASPEDAFGFEIAGTRWVKVANVFDPPEQWRLEQKDITDGKLWLGVSMVREGSYVYMYSQVKEKEESGYMAVVRVPVKSMSNPASHSEYLAKDKKWHKGLPLSDAMHVIEQPISEMSVRYHPSAKKWVAISIGAEFPSSTVVARFADSVAGPWSQPKRIYDFPEMKKTFRSYDKDTFCYAAKEHIEFTESKIAMTYACNSFVLRKTVENMDIYQPHFVMLDIPERD